jgi:hypothetical protein
MRIPKIVENTKDKKSKAMAEQQDAAMKYPKPKILLVDVEEEAVKLLQKAGWNAVSGTFGRPYKVQKGDGFFPVIVSYSLPNYSEQEIVVVDLYKEDVADRPEGEKHVPDGEGDLWAKCNTGKIDPRIRSMLTVRASFDKILYSGGIFVVFADCKKGQYLVSARKPYNELRDVTPFNADIWDFLTTFQNIDIVNSNGVETFPVTNTDIGTLLAAHLKDSHYRCTLKYFSQWAGNTKKIARNKFGETVGLVHSEGKGTIIVLPQISDKPNFLLKLIGELLPQIVPQLFPALEESRWLHRSNYELPRVIELETQKRVIEKNAQEEIAALSQEVRKERVLFGWIHDLLTGDDQPLVEAVKKALEMFGFQKVVDVDDERDKEGKSRREDLQIHDQTPH